MKSALNSAVFDQLFHQARTVNAFTEQKLTDEQLHALYDAAKMPPTAFNAQPARFVFITSQAGKEKLVPLMMQGNQATSQFFFLNFFFNLMNLFTGHLTVLGLINGLRVHFESYQ